MAEEAIKWILMITIFVCGVQDLYKKKVYLWFIITGALLITICIPFCSTNQIADRIAGVIIGVIIILISVATAGKIGLGDGILLCVTGLGIGFWPNLEMFAIALTLAALVSIFLLIFRMANRKKSIPFIPFLFMSYLILFLKP